MNYCGVCGASLSARDRANGICPLCGGALDSIAGPTAPASRPTPLWSGAPVGGTAPRATRRGWGWIALVAALLVLVAASAVILTLHGLPGASGAPPTAHGAGGGGSSATQTRAASPLASHGSPTAGVGSTATATAPGATASATASATAVPVFTVTATALPHLTVNPISINLGPCSTKTTSFTVSNSGGGTFNWTASSSTPLINVSPAHGTLSAGQDIQVTVQDTAASGKVNVEAPGVSGSPQPVTISCQGPV